MRNYRIITKQNNLTAWGGGRSQIIAPVRDSMVLKVKAVIPLIRKEEVTNYIDETLLFHVPSGTPVKFTITESITNYIDFSTNVT